MSWLVQQLVIALGLSPVLALIVCWVISFGSRREAEKAKRLRRAKLPTSGPEAIRAALEEAQREDDTVFGTDVLLTEMSDESQDKTVAFFGVGGTPLIVDISKLEEEWFKDERQALKGQPELAHSTKHEFGYRLDAADIDAAVRIADAVFRKVFGAPADYELRIDFM